MPSPQALLSQSHKRQLEISLCIFGKEQRVKDGSRVGNYLTGKGQQVLHPSSMTSWALSFEDQNPEMVLPLPPEAPLLAVWCACPTGAGSRSHTILTTPLPQQRKNTLIGQDRQGEVSGPSCQFQGNTSISDSSAVPKPQLPSKWPWFSLISKLCTLQRSISANIC